MNPDQRKILDMLAEGKITAEQAEKLLDAINRPASASAGTPAKSPQYFRVLVNSIDKEEKTPTKVNIRIPFQLLRSGIKLAALMPQDVQIKVNDAMHEKGMNFDFAKLQGAELEELIQQLGQASINVESGKDTVQIFCE